MWIHVSLVACAWLSAVVAGGLHFYADVRGQHVNVRWAPSVTDDNRLQLERQFGLIDAEPRSDRTWTYLLADRSRASIEALVQHPGIEDTQHIDRSAFRVRLDRPDLPPWVARLAETEQLDTVAWIFGVVALIASWRFRATLGQACSARVRHAASRVVSVALAVRDGVRILISSGRSVLRGSWLSVASWSRRYSPVRAWSALVTKTGSQVAIAALAVLGGAGIVGSSGRPVLRDLWLAVASAVLFVLFSFCPTTLGRRVARFRVAGLVAAVLAFGAVFAWPLFRHLGSIGRFADWDQHLTLHWVQYETVRLYGQIPLWNPYVCGGIPLLGNPQSRLLTPFFLLHLWYGPELALQLEIIAHIGIGWAGAWLLGRVVGLSWVASLAPATIFAGCSYFYLHLAEGHTTWLAFAYMPGILAAAAANRPVLAGLGLALAIGEGGAYPVPHTMLALAVLALHRGIVERSTRPVTNLGVTVIMAACVAAPKLLLMQPLLAQYPRFTQSAETVSLELVARALLDPNQDLGTAVPAGHPYGFHEYGAYVGSIPVMLAIYGMVAAGRRTMPWVLLFGMGLALSLGGTLGGPYSPWDLLHQLPVFASLRIPSRFLVFSVLAVGMLAGFGIDRLVSTRVPWRMAIAIAVLVMATLDLALVGPPILRRLADAHGESSEGSATFVQFYGDDGLHMYPAAQAHMGSLNCYEPLHPAVAPVGVGDAGYRGEQYLLHDGAVRLVEWSPNRLTLAVSSKAQNVLVVNYNYDAFWQVVSGGGQTFNHEGLLGVSIPAGSQELVLAYQTPRLMAGLLLAIAGLAVAAWTALRR